MNFIEIDLSNQQSLIKYDKVAGRQGESCVKGIKLVLPEEYLDWDISVETENANGFAKKYPIDNVEDNVATYLFKKKDLEAKGRLLLDLVLEKDDKVFKPFCGEFAVKFAICATDTEWDDDIEVDLTGYALKKDIPRKLSELNNDVGFVTDKNLNQSVKESLQSALEDAKENGEFNGNDGLSAYQIWINMGNTGTEADFLESLKGKNGSDGDDGVSVTHEWNGAVLTITSESGTSSADLKGDKGDSFTYEDFTPEQLELLKGADGYTPVKGIDYFDGKKGNDGKTPIKGTDYFTEEDKSELVTAVLIALPKAEEDVF